MSRLVVAAVAAGLLAVPASVAARCPKVRSNDVLLRNHAGVIYKHRLRSVHNGPQVIAYGCTARYHTVHRINPEAFGLGYEYIQAKPLAIVGRYVAFAYMRDSNGDDVVTTVAVRPMNDGLVVRSFSAIANDSGLGHTVTVTDMALRPDAGLAWIAALRSGASPPAYELRAAGRDGAVRTIDSSPAIGPHSLELTPTGLSWTDAGVRRSAAF